MLGPAGEPCTSRGLARSRQGCASGTHNVETARAPLLDRHCTPTAGCRPPAARVLGQARQG